MVFFLFIFLSSLFFLFLYSVHYTVFLLGIELILLGVFFVLVMCYVGSFGLVGLFLFFLVMVCMGGFSISLLVSLARGFGKDFWCPSNVF